MRRSGVRFAMLLVALVSSGCGDDVQHTGICRGPLPCSLDSGIDTGGENWCNPLTQVGCPVGNKCTWVIDENAPHYVGHIGCEPDGTAALGSSCTYGAAGATGYDNCVTGSLCSSFALLGSGTCKAICDTTGGPPRCGSDGVCVAEPPAFSAGLSSPPEAGICEPACDPLADNDFDGPGSALGRSGSACGTADIGCYGNPTATPPGTQFWCQRDLHYTTPLRHRTECTSADGCADADTTLHINSCNQGYEPLLRESLAVSTTICVALCAPADCYAGNCGSNNANRLGAAPHRCETPDALGAFGSDEECQYLWRDEIDGSGNWQRSAYSDRVGYCVDRAAYGEPSCALVPLHGAAGSNADAVLLGCVSSQAAGLVPAQRKQDGVLDHRTMR